MKYLLPAALSTLLLATCATTGTTDPANSTNAQVNDVETVRWSVPPVQCHGALQVKNGRVVDSKSGPFSVVGPSFFWSTTGWGQERFYNSDAVKWVAEDWQSGIVRAAISGHRDGGYVDDPDANMSRARAIIDGAIEAGLYVIVDWHSHHAERDTKEATAFFQQIAREYGGTPNLIYEIYNEPLDTTSWEGDIKPYASKVIAAIRAIDPDNLIVVGTRSWSQRLDEALASPLTGYDNIAYTLHFYAGRHKDELRQIARDALDGGLPVMITEWGGMMHTGDGALDYPSMQKWMDLASEYALTSATWSIADKDESASAVRDGAPSKGGWTQSQLTPWGNFARNLNQSWPKSCAS